MMNYNGAIEQMQQQMGKFGEPARQISSSVLDHWTKVAEYQMDMARRYTDFAFGQMREASGVQSPEELQSYLHKSSEAARLTGDSLAKDVRTLAEMNHAMTTEVQQVVRDSAANLAPSATAGGKASAAKAA